MPIKSEMTTAKLCAFARAYHSNTSRDKVFDDYLAYDLIGKSEYDDTYDFIGTDITAGSANSAGFIKRYLEPVTLFRIRFTENKLKVFAAEHGLCQYVICGAGYDTFSFRNTNENIEIFEVDHPDMQAFKKRRIEELEWNIPKNVRFVAVDFEKNDFVESLLKTGFDPKRKTFFSILGVSYYLTLPVFAKTISYIADIASPGSMLVFDYPDETIHHSQSKGRARKLAVLTEGLGEAMNGGYCFEDMSEVMRSEGFRIDSHLAPADIQERYFDGKPDGMKAIKGIYIVAALRKEDSNYTI